MTSLHQTCMTLHNRKQTIAPNMGEDKYAERTPQSKQTKHVRFDLSRNKIHPIEKRNNVLTFTDIIKLHSFEYKIHSRRRNNC